MTQTFPISPIALETAARDDVIVAQTIKHHLFISNFSKIFIFGSLRPCRRLFTRQAGAHEWKLLAPQAAETMEMASKQSCSVDQSQSNGLYQMETSSRV